MSDSAVVFKISERQALIALRNLEETRKVKKNSSYHRERLEEAVKDMCVAIQLKKAGK